jgi:hypothetical protein
MRKPPRKTGHNVVPLPLKITPGPAGPAAVAGSPDDPRMREAVRLMEAFLAIEDGQGRAALITLAELMVSYDWVRRAQQH